LLVTESQRKNNENLEKKGEKSGRGKGCLRGKKDETTSKGKNKPTFKKQ